MCCLDGDKRDSPCFVEGALLQVLFDMLGRIFLVRKLRTGLVSESNKRRRLTESAPRWPMKCSAGGVDAGKGRTSSGY